jgi:predicted HTH domain antitoxin
MGRIRIMLDEAEKELSSCRERMLLLDSEAAAKKELALALHSRGALSLGKAVEMAGVARADFEILLGRRRVERPYTVAELEHDLTWARGKQ